MLVLRGHASSVIARSLLCGATACLLASAASALEPPAPGEAGMRPLLPSGVIPPEPGETPPALSTTAPRRQNLVQRYSGLNFYENYFLVPHPGQVRKSRPQAIYIAFWTRGYPLNIGPGLVRGLAEDRAVAAIGRDPHAIPYPDALLILGYVKFNLGSGHGGP
jgi:hypothetical protein